DQREAVTVERELGFTIARVLDSNLARIVGAVPARHTGRRLDAIGGRLLAAAYQIMKRRGQGLRGYSGIERHDWTPPMLGRSRLIVVCAGQNSQLAAASLSCVFVSKSLASWRSCN